MITGETLKGGDLRDGEEIDVVVDVEGVDEAGVEVVIGVVVEEVVDIGEVVVPSGVEVDVVVEVVDGGAATSSTSGSMANLAGSNTVANGHARRRPPQGGHGRCDTSSL